MSSLRTTDSPEPQPPVSFNWGFVNVSKELPFIDVYTRVKYKPAAQSPCFSSNLWDKRSKNAPFKDVAAILARDDSVLQHCFIKLNLPSEVSRQGVNSSAEKIPGLFKNVLPRKFGPAKLLIRTTFFSAKCKID